MAKGEVEMAVDPDQLEALDDSLADYSTKLEEVINDISDKASDKLVAVWVTEPHHEVIGSDPNPYFERSTTPEISSGPNPWEYDYAAYRRDIDELITLLYRFIDDADPGRFDTINELLKDVYDLLSRAVQFDGGLNDVSIAMSGWTGGAATNFRDLVIRPFGARLLRQVSLARELATAALSYKAILLCARADVLDLAEQLRSKASYAGDGGGSLSLGSAFALVGSVAGGIGLLTGGPVAWPALVGWAAGAAGTANSIIAEISPEEVTEEYALNGIERNAGGGKSEERKIQGWLALEFIPSATEKIDLVLTLAEAEERRIRDGLKADLEEIEGDGERPLEFSEPDLITTDTLAGLGAPPDLTIGDIVGLKKVGAKDLPAVAYLLHLAHAKVATVRFAFESGISNSAVVGAYRANFESLVDRLDDALTQARDFLYESGLNLVEIADGYYETEEESRQALEGQLAQEEITLAEHIAANDYPDYITPENISFDDLYRQEVEDFDDPTYRPDPPPVRMGGPF
jgi:hypothetical protein